jgi:hypothetical protein
METSIIKPLPIGAVPPMGWSPPPGVGPGGGGGGGAEALLAITGTMINNPVMIRFNIDFLII